jgi:hypothetical protein
MLVRGRYRLERQKGIYPLTLYPRVIQNGVAWPEVIEATYQALVREGAHGLAPRLPHLELAETPFLASCSFNYKATILGF